MAIKKRMSQAARKSASSRSPAKRAVKRCECCGAAPCRCPKSCECK